MTKYFISTFFCCLLFCESVFSQNKKTDSLLTVIKSNPKDTTKVNTYTQLFLQIEFEDVVKAREYLDSALILSLRANYKKGLAVTYMYLGYSCEDRGQYQEALKNYSLALNCSQELKDNKSICAASNNIGNVYYNQGNYPDALKNYFLSLKMREAINDKNGIAGSHTNIGLVYFHQGNYVDALKNYENALKLFAEVENKDGLAMAYNNIGLVYYYQANYSESLKNYSASLKIAEELGNKRGLAECYNYIGGIYDIQKEYDKALQYYFKSLEIQKMMGYQKGMATCYGNIGITYTKRKKYQLAEENLKQAEKILKEIGAKSNLKLTYMALTVLDSSKGDFKSAYRYHKLFVAYKDSMDNEETRKNTIQNKMTYDFEKKEAVAKAEYQKEIERQKDKAEEESRKQNLIILIIIIGLLVVAIFAGFIFRSLKLTRSQKNIIEHQKHLVEEHQRGIIDSITYAKRLQKAILPSDEEIKKHLSNYFILYKPKDIVAGDFYWMHEGSDVIYIAAADSTGHGVPGAMVSVICSNALNRAVNEFNIIETGKILDKTRDLVLDTYAKSGEEISDGMDISLMAINKTKKQICWSGANNPLWIINANSVNSAAILTEIKADKQPIGKTDYPKPFTTHTLEFNQGDTFYLVTDGYPDQFGGPKGKKFKYKSLKDKLVVTSHLTLEQQHEDLLISFDDWRGNLEQVDDITIIGIRL